MGCVHDEHIFISQVSKKGKERGKKEYKHQIFDVNDRHGVQG